jgi:hypothetical protein
VKPVTDDDPLPVVPASELDDGEAVARWLIEPLWARAAVGVLGGAPKCCKSWLALDLAVSVASNSDCLGAFSIDDPGPVLLYMAEDAAPVVRHGSPVSAALAASTSQPFPSTSSRYLLSASIVDVTKRAFAKPFAAVARASCCSIPSCAFTASMSHVTCRMSRLM